MPLLLVLGESDPLRLNLLEEACRTAGFDVSPAMDGESVLASVARQPPALIVLASELPRLDGLAVLRILKREKRLQPIPVLVIAADEKDAATAKAIGAEGVLEVPFEVARVQAKVRSTLQKARERRLERKRAVSMEQLRAALDSESGAGTRAQLLLSLDYEHTRALRYGTSLGCLVIDVDRLPAQVARPIALAGVVEAAKSALEGLDLIFRAADLRFVVLLPAIDLAGVERARAAVRTAVLDAVPGVALSFAGASMPEHAAEGGPALLAAALGNRFV